MAGPSDRDLLDAINGRPPWEERSSAWEALWDRYLPLALKTARRVTRNDALADEAVGRVAERFTALAFARRLRVTTSYPALLARSVHYAWLDVVRERSRWVEATDATLEGAGRDRVTDDESPERYEAIRRAADIVTDALLLLARDGRTGWLKATILRRRFIDGESATKLYEELRLPERTFFHWQEKALKEFRDILEQHFGFDADDL